MKPVPEWVIEGSEPINNPQPHRYGEIVKDAVDSLDEEDRWCVEMYFYERIPFSEMAHRMELAGRSSAAYRLGRALGHLERALEERGITDVSFDRPDVEDDVYGGF